MSVDSAGFIRSVAIDWARVAVDSYVRRIPSIRSLDELDVDVPVTFFVGENGAGKSTLLEAIAVAYGFNAEGGTLNYRFSTYDDVSSLGDALTISRGRAKSRAGFFFRAESFFNVATKALEYGGSPHARTPPVNLHRQSHGESFLAYFSSSRGAALDLMDEPEAALSPQRQLALMALISERAQDGSQFIIATHSPILLGLPGARILDFDGGAVRPCTYEQTESYRVTELFMNHRDAVLHHLFGDDSEAPSRAADTAR